MIETLPPSNGTPFHGRTYNGEGKTGAEKNKQTESLNEKVVGKN